MSGEATTVWVELPGREYPIEIGAGLLGSAGGAVRGRVGARRATIISDETVARLYGGRLGRSLLEAGMEYALLTVSPGDGSKSLEVAKELYDALAELRHERGEPIIALGGGMVGDLAGFVAATWLRGVPLVHCPTTLEAAIDAAVGGKTAVNHPAGKNLIGAFHQPILVCTDINCLASLSDRDYRAALAESVKHAVVADPEFLTWHQTLCKAIYNRESAPMQELIRRNCVIKADVVVRDERETAETDVGRAALNFGHTIGHALEAQSAYALRHGEAVALGMVAELDLAVRLAGFPEKDRQGVEGVLDALGLSTRHDIRDVDDIYDRLWRDKKNRNQAIRFAIPSRPGVMQWLEGPVRDAVFAALHRLRRG